MHFGEHVLAVGEGAVLDVEVVQVRDLDQVVADQAQLLHLAGCQEVFFDDVAGLALFDLGLAAHFGWNGAWVGVRAVDDQVLVPD